LAPAHQNGTCPGVGRRASSAKSLSKEGLSGCKEIDALASILQGLATSRSAVSIQHD
jgi:hypothetical protein